MTSHDRAGAEEVGLGLGSAARPLVLVRPVAGLLLEEVRVPGPIRGDHPGHVTRTSQSQLTWAPPPARSPPGRTRCRWCRRTPRAGSPRPPPAKQVEINFEGCLWLGRKVWDPNIKWILAFKRIGNINWCVIDIGKGPSFLQNVSVIIFIIA